MLRTHAGGVRPSSEMSNIREILNNVELHDSSLVSLTMHGDGSMELLLDIDGVWNKNLAKSIKGILVHSVYEIAEFTIDRLNVIGSVELEDIEGYNKEFVTHDNSDTTTVVKICIEFVAGGELTIICSGSAEYLL